MPMLACEAIRKLNQYLCDTGEFGYIEFSPVETFYNNSKAVYQEYCCDPVEGDWKHTHLRMDYLIKKFFEENNIPFLSIDHEYLDDTGKPWEGSDYGEAYHFITLPIEVSVA